MKVRISGFQLTFHPKLDIDTLYTELTKKHATKFKFQLHQRFLRVVDDGDYFIGSLLTDRGHKNFLAIDTQTNEPSRGTLGQRKNFGAFNFFVLCKRKKTALITSYR